MRKVGIDLDKVGIPTLRKKSTGQFRNFTDTYLGMDKKYNNRHIKRGKGKKKVRKRHYFEAFVYEEDRDIIIIFVLFIYFFFFILFMTEIVVSCHCIQNTPKQLNDNREIGTKVWLSLVWLL